MSDVKAIRARIRSVSSMMHLTNAMGLVASSKIRRANEAMQNSRLHLSSLENVVELLAAYAECAKSPCFGRGGDRLRLIVVAGDRGLAGGYNANVLRSLTEFSSAEVIPIGKRACDRVGAPHVSSEYFSAGDAYTLARMQCADFLAGKYDRLTIVSTGYVSATEREVRVRDLLPLARGGKRGGANVIFEPDANTVLAWAIVEYTAGAIIASVRESFACEVAARRMAMESAGRSAAAMKDELTLEFNRVRQSEVTREISEIVAGSDA